MADSQNQQVQDTFRYSVELDTQGLAAQLASVRDTIANGLGAAGRGIMGGAAMVSGAANQITSDIFMGQQMVSMAIPAQSMPRVGIAQTTLAQVPGMPQGAFEEMAAASGLSSAPVGVFPAQFQAVARQRLQERAQNAAVATVAGGISMVASEVGGKLGGALAGSALGATVGGTLGSVVPVVGTVLGAIGGAVLADTVMKPFLEDMQMQMSNRARVQQIFGWNQFKDDERAAVANSMRGAFNKSLFNEAEFNSVLPSATMAGFFRGVGRGDVQGMGSRFRAAESFFTESQFALGTSGAEGIQVAGQLARGFRKLGTSGPDEVGRFFRQANVLGQEMRELGEFVDPTEIIQQQMAVGSAAASMGMSPQRAMETFAGHASMTNRLMREGKMNEEDLAMLGGSPGEAAQRLSMSVMATQRQPIFRAMALAFGQTDSITGRASMNQAALESMGAGRMSFSALSERLSQTAGSGAGGTTKMLSLMANQNKLQGDMAAQQGQVLRGMTDDILKQANLEATDGTRQFIMQRVFGVGEAESRALVQGLPMEKADRERVQTESARLDKDIKGAVGTAQDGLARQVEALGRSIKETFSKPLDDMTRAIANQVAPPLQTTIPDRLESIDRKLGAGAYRSNSPISTGPITFSPEHDRWMTPADPMSFQGFRAVGDSRRFPEPMVAAQASAPMLRKINGMTAARETMAG